MKVNSSHLLSWRANVNLRYNCFHNLIQTMPFVSQTLLHYSGVSKGTSLFCEKVMVISPYQTLWQNVTMSRKPTRHSVIIRLRRWSKPLYVKAVHPKYHIRKSPASKYHVPPSPLWCFCLFMTACAACSGTRAGSDRILVVVLRCRIASDTTKN